MELKIIWKWRRPPFPLCLVWEYPILARKLCAELIGAVSFQKKTTTTTGRFHASKHDVIRHTQLKRLLTVAAAGNGLREWKGGLPLRRRPTVVVVVLPTKVVNSTRRERQNAARLYSSSSGGGGGGRRASCAARLGMYRERAPAGKKATRPFFLFVI